METKYEQLDLFNLLTDKVDKLTKIINLPTTDKNDVETFYVSQKAYNNADNLYWKTRLIAREIYKAHEWNDDQILEAAKIIFPYLGYKKDYNNLYNRLGSVHFVSDQKQRQFKLIGKSDQNYCIPIYFKMQENDYYKRFLVLSDSDELYSRFTNMYLNKKYYFVRFTYLSKEYLLGFATIIKSFMSHYTKNTDYHFSSYEVTNLLKGLIAGARSSNYMYYDYMMTNKDVIKKMRLGSPSKLYLYNRDLDAPSELCDYFENFIEQHYNLAVKKGNTQVLLAK